MLLGEIFPGQAGSAADLNVESLEFDNREVKPGTLFFCVKGLSSDGHDFAQSAIDAGAVALVVERDLGLGVPEVRVDSVRKAMGPAADVFYGSPSDELKVVGVTGTNGKTTTAYLVRHLLQCAGLQTGLVGTVETVVAGERVEAIRTTPEAIGLQKLFRQMLDGGDAAAAIEVSSHALDLGRVDGTQFAVSIFTNLTQDHLDWHGTMDEYWQSKRRLFTDLPCGLPVVNIDDPYGADLAASLGEVVTVGFAEDAQWRAGGLVTGLSGSSFHLRSPIGEAEVEMPLPGKFNVLNALGAAAATAGLGLTFDQIVEGLRTATGVPGRFEPVTKGQPFAVLVDYAHTPDSLQNVLDAARGIADSRVICVVGCGGDRDAAKRPLMGAIAATSADVAILTSDNPRSEEPEEILREMTSGGDHNWRVVVDRRAAIRMAVEEAKAGDVVLIAGKGHEQGQEFGGGEKVPFDDRVVAAEELATAGWSR